jgi:hypothetical protein
MLRSKWVRALALLSAVGVALSLPVTSTAARPSPPSLKLLSVLQHTKVVRYNTDSRVYISPGVYVASTDGTFEIDATREPDGTIALWQVSRDSRGAHLIRQITPPTPVRLSAGLPQFFHLDVTNADGVSVASKNIAYCLNGGYYYYGSARVDASGPDQATFPYGCGDSRSEAAVWGIDAGWANPLFFGFRLNAPDGNYTLTISIAPEYVQQLGIPAESATASIALTVKTRHVSKCGRKCPPPPVVALDPALSGNGAQPLGEGPDTSQPSGSDSTGLRHADGVPDLRALAPHSLKIFHNKRTGRDYLAFGATIWNAGSGPLVVEGFRSGSAPVMQATQFIYRDGAPVSSSVVGEFEYDTRKGHHHWHMEDIAQYDLLDQSGNRVVLSSKQSFCLAPTDAINLTLPGADWQPDRERLWSACAGRDSIWLREVLPAGWGDTYYQYVAGQSFNVTSLPNGHYQVRVTTDPNHNLLETNYDNNVGLLSFTLGGTPGHRTVRMG